MLRVSVIIVSYNVYPFLDNCLRSVRQALLGIAGEIFVVDNASVDRTPQLVQTHFPEVKLIANAENKGFAKANNQAISQATGEFILILNPDTILSEDTLSTCLQFMDKHPDAGAVGVRMLDGSGKFLPESKRGLPTLSSSFMKMTGLYHLFPRSPRWNRYYQGQVGEHETARVEVLTGAFMFIRSSALEKTGLLDEDFFMYGEDIDLSYRITRAGFGIYYLPTTSIIHYKGESTKKASLNYILTFYQAMLIFTQKHPELRGQQLLIKIAIYLHGITQLLRQGISRSWPIAMDTLLLLGSFFLVSRIWSIYYFKNPDYFQPAFYAFNLPLYTVIGISGMFFNGAYDRPLEIRRSWVGFFSGMIFLLVVYAFLPVHLRTSRMVILLGAFLFLFILLLTRTFLSPWKKSAREGAGIGRRRAIIAGGKTEADRIKELINRTRDQIEIVGTVSPGTTVDFQVSDSLGPLSKLDEIIRVHQIKEIIFSAQDVPFSAFTGSISSLGPGFRYMLAAGTTMNIVGSMNRDTEGESYGLRVHFNLSHPTTKRAKRLFDVLTSLLLIPLYPLLALVISNPGNLLKNIFRVMAGRITWVSYHPNDPSRSSLPPLKDGVLAPVYPAGPDYPVKRLEHIHYVYARDYHWMSDLAILAAQWKKLGQNLVAHEN